jgi:hypothetical protein
MHEFRCERTPISEGEPENPSHPHLRAILGFCAATRDAQAAGLLKALIANGRPGERRDDQRNIRADYTRRRFLY